MKKRPRGFTLVELLAVILAVGTLFVFGTVAWRHAIERTRATQCLSHLRVIGSASMLYAADHDMTLPVTSHQRQSGLKSWTLSLQEYTSGTVSFRCPCDEVEGRPYTYVINDFLTPHPAGAANLDFSQLSRLDAPSETLFFAEASPDYQNSDHFHFAEYVEQQTIPSDFFASQVATQRHLGGANYLFADGHVEALSWPAVQERLRAPRSRFVDPMGHYPTTTNQPL